MNIKYFNVTWIINLKVTIFIHRIEHRIKQTSLQFIKYQSFLVIKLLCHSYEVTFFILLPFIYYVTARSCFSVPKKISWSPDWLWGLFFFLCSILAFISCECFILFPQGLLELLECWLLKRLFVKGLGK